MTEPRLCDCDCGQSLDGRRRNVQYVNRSHQQRAYRAKVKAEAEANGIPGSLSLRTVRAQHRTSNRHVDGPVDRTGHQRARKRAPDLRISYLKAVDTVADLILALDTGLDGNAAQRYVGAFIRAEHELRPLLTERQRAALDRREVAP